MKDYAARSEKSYLKLSAEEKLKRIAKILATDLPPIIMVCCIMLLVRTKR